MSGYNSGKYDFEQQTVCLSNLSTVSFNISGSSLELAKKVKDEIELVLSDDRVRELIGKWNLIWGPSVHADSFIGKAKAVNSMFLVAPEDHPDHAVVVIAGTNGTSLMTWVQEDFNVSQTVLWPYTAEDCPSTPKISKGVAHGLQRLVEMTNPFEGGEGEITLRNFLKDHPSITDIMVTGHSLGGALSPLYALYLEDTRGDWASTDVSLSCLPTAGQTSGDQVFAEYYGKKLGHATKRVWNEIDVVPNAFNSKSLTQVPTLYEPEIHAPLVLQMIVESIRRNVRDQNYLNILPETPGFPFKYLRLSELAGKHRQLVEFFERMLGGVRQSLSSGGYHAFGGAQFIMQALIQHTVSYVMYFKIDDFTTEMMRVTKHAVADPGDIQIPGIQDETIKDVREGMGEFVAESNNRYSNLKEEHEASYGESVFFFTGPRPKAPAKGRKPRTTKTIEAKVV